MKRSVEDAGSIGTALSLRAQTSNTNLAKMAAERRMQNNSHCNLFEEEEASERSPCGGEDEPDAEMGFRAKRNSAYDRYSALLKPLVYSSGYIPEVCGRR